MFSSLVLLMNLSTVDALNALSFREILMTLFYKWTFGSVPFRSESLGNSGIVTKPLSFLL